MKVFLGTCMNKTPFVIREPMHRMDGLPCGVLPTSR